MKETTNIVIYARYSSASQNEQSIEGQLKVCYEFAERCGYTVIGEYIDRAISGTNAHNRPEFQRMIADSSKRQFMGILVYQLDRFARNRYDSATYKTKLKKNNVRVLSARENITDDASGILMEAVLEGMAEYFSEELSQKTKRGMEISAQKCLFTGGSLALGLKSVDRKILIDEDTAPIVRKIFDLYLSGKTMAEIIRYLNDNGIKTSKGNPYNKNSIRNILTNRRYIGIYTYNDLEIADGIPRLIDDDTFERAQIQLEKNKKAPARSKAVEDNYLLTTKLYCGHCGSVMVGVSGTSQTKKLYQYYQCVNQRRKGGCDKKSVNKLLLENKVVNGVFEALNNSYIETVAKKIADLSVKEGNTDQLKRIKKQLRENEVATENLIKAIEKGTAIELISSQIEKRQQEKLLLETELAKEKILSPNLTFEQVKFYFDKYKQGDINSTEFRTSLVDTFVRKIVLSDDDSGKYLDIYCNASAENIRIPLDDFSSPKGNLAPST